MKIYSIDGKELYNCEDATTVKEALIAALKNGANLHGAHLMGANLSGANLSHADLRGANMIGANLRGANMIDANLRYADLSGADLRGADLRGANLRGANLRGADMIGANLIGADLRGANMIDAIFGNGIEANKPIIQIETGVYFLLIFDDHMKIGCEIHSFSDWFSFDDRRIMEMDRRRALDFWMAWKEPLRAICEARK